MSDIFDLTELDTADEGRMRVVANGVLTDWEWIFAGPGHPQTIAQSDRLAKERLRREREITQAQVNGKKWKEEAQTPDEALTKNVQIIIDRLIGWTPVKMGGADFPFTPENAKKILMDRRKGQLLMQALDFLGEEKSFTQRSETNSEPSPSAHLSSEETKRAEHGETA